MFNNINASITEINDKKGKRVLNKLRMRKIEIYNDPDLIKITSKRSRK